MTATLRVAVREFDPFATALERQFADFRRMSGADAALEIVAMDLNPLHEALFERRELASGAWDIAFLSTDWIAEAQASGLVADLDPFLADQPIPDFPDAWSPSLLGLQRFAGGFWGMPYHDGPQCLIYRTDLLAAAGLPVPTTWEGFHEAARRLHRPGEGRYGTVLALFPDGHNSFYDFCIHIWTRGGEPFDAAGRPAFTAPAAVDALDFIRALAADDAAVAPNLSQIDSVRSGLLFCEGRVALMTNWFGFAALADTDPSSAVRGKVGVAPIPSADGRHSVSLNVFWMLVLASGSRQKDFAWAFIRHCSSAPMDRITTQAGAIGTRRSTWSDLEINRTIPYYHDLDTLHAAARQMPVHPRLAALSHSIDAMLATALDSERTSADLLAAAQAEAERILA